MIIVNGWKALTIVTKRPILDVDALKLFPHNTELCKGYSVRISTVYACNSLQNSILVTLYKNLPYFRIDNNIEIDLSISLAVLIIFLMFNKCKQPILIYLLT